MIHRHLSSSSRARISFPVLSIALLALTIGGSASCTAAEWSSPLLSEISILIEKNGRTSSFQVSKPKDSITPAYDDLPPSVSRALGAAMEDYGKFVVARVGPERLASLVADLAEQRLAYTTDLPREIELPFSHFDPGKGPRNQPREGFDRAIEGLFILQFAYPIRPEWLQTLSKCGIEPIASLQYWTELVRAPSSTAISRCVPTRLLTWFSSFQAGDRLPALSPGEGEGEFTLQYLPGTPCSAKLHGLSTEMTALDDDGRPLAATCGSARSDFLRVHARPDSIEQLALRDANLLVAMPSGNAAFSDERQGQIVSGHHNGATLTGPGYKAWLQSRGLFSATNAQTVATHDGGYDDGSFVGGTDGSGDHHPDLETPDRLAGTATFPSSATHDGDAFGHGTMVAGIIAGDVVNPAAAGAKDSGSYLYGLGIAPTSRIAAARFGTSVGIQSLGTQEEAHRWSSAKSQIINESWNKFQRLDGVDFSVPRYDDMAQAFDGWTLDADGTTPGAQRVLEIVAASNYAAASGSPQFDTVSSPATAKNVLTVGATESDRPISTGPGSTSRCQDDATQIGKIARFSGRGREFGPSSAPSFATNTRIKPDLVAPGVRVFSTVPFQYAPYSAVTAVGCAPFFPVGSFYTYGSGTSFAAPVVSGMVALKRQQLINRGTSNPSPSLLKAALIATADSLGGVAGNDHRPSPIYGWGRANLDRLTDSRSTLIRDENTALAVSTGQERVFVGTVDSGSSETRIVLVWSDPPSGIAADSQAPLVNDLQLKVEFSGQGGQYVGNNFNEVVTGVDDGFSYRAAVGPFFNDSKNTVEAIFIPANSFTVGSSVTIHVLGTNVTAGSQKFSLYAYNVR